LRPGQNGSAQKTGGRDLIPLSHLITEWMK
jgi:hypothetical protein